MQSELFEHKSCNGKEKLHANSVAAMNIVFEHLITVRKDLDRSIHTIKELQTPETAEKYAEELKHLQNAVAIIDEIMAFENLAKHTAKALKHKF